MPDIFDQVAAAPSAAPAAHGDIFDQVAAQPSAAPHAAQFHNETRARALEHMQLDNPYNFADTSSGGFWDSAKEAVSGLVHGLVHVPTVAEASPTGTGDAMKDLPAPTVQRATDQALAGNYRGAAGTVAGTTAALAAPAVLHSAVERAAPVAAKYGARVVANAPAVADVLGQGAMVAGKQVPGLSHVIKAAEALQKAGVYADLKTAVTDLLTKPTKAELRTNINRTPRWANFPDVEAELAGDAAPEAEPLTEAPATLPSGRTPGGIENQSEPAPVAPKVSRPAPAWQTIPTPAPAPPVEAAPAAPATLPSGRTPGGIARQSEAAPEAPEHAAPTSPSTPPALSFPEPPIAWNRNISESLSPEQMAEILSLKGEALKAALAGPERKLILKTAMDTWTATRTQLQALPLMAQLTTETRPGGLLASFHPGETALYRGYSKNPVGPDGISAFSTDRTAAEGFTSVWPDRVRQVETTPTHAALSFKAIREAHGLPGIAGESEVVLNERAPQPPEPALAAAQDLKAASDEGTLVELPEDAKAALMDAVLQDHPSVIKHILATKEAPTAGPLAVYQNADNKARVFHRYLSETGIDPATAQQLETGVALIDQFKQDAGAALPRKPSIKQYRALAEKTGRLDVVDALEHVQSVADGAHAFAVEHQLPAGKEYQLLSPAAWDLVRERFGAKPGEAFAGAAARLVPPAPEVPARRLLASEPPAAPTAPEPAPVPTGIDIRSGAQKQADAILARAKAEAAKIVAEAQAKVTPAGNSQTAPAPPQLRDEPTRETRGTGRGDETGSGAIPGSDRTSEGLASPAQADTLIKVPGRSDGYQARYALRELTDIQPSHNGLTFEPNPKYQIKNDRNYNNAVNQAKVVNWSSRAEFDPSYHITDTPDALNGPVVIDSDGNVLGANGRTMILQRVYQHNPEGAAQYRALLEKKAAQFGIDPADVRRMKQPVLTRVIDDAEFEPGSGKSKQGAVTDFNVKGTADLTPAERAIADSRRVSDRTLSDIAARLEAEGTDATLAEILEGKSGLDVLAHLVDDGVIASQEQAAYAGKEALTKAGKERVSQLMLGRFFHDPAHLDNIAPVIRNKVERLAAPLAQVEGLGDAWNLTPHVQDALALLDRMRDAGAKNLADFIRQDGLFGTDKYTPAAQTLAQALLEKTQRQLTEAARAYAEDAQFAAKGDSLFGAPPTPAETFEKYFGQAPEAAKLSGAERQAAEVMAKAKAGKAEKAPAPDAPAPAKKPRSLKDIGH